MKKILLYPLTTEKAIKMIEVENKISFVVDRKANKEEIAMAIRENFGAKVRKINVHISKNKKIAYIKLGPETPAIDIATKLGMI
ncbi:MAG: 50S ribosomal protein L23 [Candidatus Pacearchaeota archaeon]|nr:50S ribosomal protein L23 [Candidatus Pacearchaeota archaeon]